MNLKKLCNLNKYLYKRVLAQEKWTSAGGVVVNDKGEIALVKPSGEFGGYKWTFPKGRVEGREMFEQTALREVKEESGLIGDIVELIGKFEGTSSLTYYYLMKLVKDTGHHDWETEKVEFVTPEKARGMLNSERDQKVLDKALQKWGHVFKKAVKSDLATYLFKGWFNPKTKEDREVATEHKAQLPGDFKSIKDAVQNGWVRYGAYSMGGKTTIYIQSNSMDNDLLKTMQQLLQKYKDSVDVVEWSTEEPWKEYSYPSFWQVQNYKQVATAEHKVIAINRRRFFVKKLLNFLSQDFTKGYTPEQIATSLDADTEKVNHALTYLTESGIIKNRDGLFGVEKQTASYKRSNSVPRKKVKAKPIVPLMSNEYKRLREEVQKVVSSIKTPTAEAINNSSAADLKLLNNLYKEYGFSSFYYSAHLRDVSKWFKNLGDEYHHKINSLGLDTIEVLKDLGLKDILRARVLNLSIMPSETKVSLKQKIQEAENGLSKLSPERFEQEHLSIKPESVLKAIRSSKAKQHIINLAKFVHRGKDHVFKTGDIWGSQRRLIADIFDKEGLIKFTKKTQITFLFVLTPLGFKVGERIRELGISNVEQALTHDVPFTAEDTKSSLIKKIEKAIAPIIYNEDLLKKYFKIAKSTCSKFGLSDLLTPEGTEEAYGTGREPLLTLQYKVSAPLGVDKQTFLKRALQEKIGRAQTVEIQYMPAKHVLSVEIPLKKGKLFY